MFTYFYNSVLEFENNFFLSNYQEVETIYTHHQKTVIVDADAGNGKRKIVAFVGGLDLCDGRYDNPHHPIFRTLETLHKDDYHNPTFTVVYLCLVVLLLDLSINHFVNNKSKCLN